ncbi:MAG: 2-oxo acid dehydrogenase subunit E2 [Cyclobacteriaceae bacterium]
MSIELKMPQISEDAESGTIVEILVSEGDTIEEEQSIIAVESDKASVEVPAESGGKVKEIKVSEGDEIEVGDILLILEEAGEAEEDEEEDEAEAKDQQEEEDEAEAKKKKEEDQEEDDDDEAESKEKKDQEEDKEAEAKNKEDKEDKKKKPEDRDTESSGKKEGEKGKNGEVPAAPSVRRLARELDVDIYAVKGSGPGDRITADDVKAAAENGQAKEKPEKEKGKEKEATSRQESGLPDFSQWGEVERHKMSGIRKATAKSMAGAWNTIPHVTQFDKANISTLEAFMDQYEAKAEKAGVKLTITAVLVKLSASAMRAFPKFNASVDIDNQEIVMKKYVNIGVAVDTDNGLLVPVIQDADRKSVIQISRELTELAGKAREGSLKGEEMSGGNFTVSNLGGIGGTNFTPIVYHPQVAILGVSRNQVEPVWEDGEFKPKTMLPLSLSYDHRAIDGAEAARFLRWMCQVMEDPFVMLMEGGL